MAKHRIEVRVEMDREHALELSQWLEHEARKYIAFRRLSTVAEVALFFPLPAVKQPAQKVSDDSAE